MFQVDLGQGKSGCAQITTFITMTGGVDRFAEGVIIRWMDKKQEGIKKKLGAEGARVP